MIGLSQYRLPLFDNLIRQTNIDEYAALAIAETKKKGAFVFPGIGKSALVKRKARMGRNPATGETIKIPAKTVVRIKPAKAFKEAIVPSKK